MTTYQDFTAMTADTATEIVQELLSKYIDKVSELPNDATIQGILAIAAASHIAQQLISIGIVLLPPERASELVMTALEDIQEGLGLDSGLIFQKHGEA